MTASTLVGQETTPEWVLGSWTGLARVASEETRIRINIENTDGNLSASVDLLDIGVVGWPAREASAAGEEVVVVIPSDGGPQRLAMRRTSTGTLRGTWSETGLADTAMIELHHSELIEPAMERTLSVMGPAGQLGFSLMVPTEQPVLAGAVFVHGSGPESRDASRFAAIMLAERGVASAFYDKRGVGESEGDWRSADFDDLAADVVAIADALAEETGLAPGLVGLIGTSQGGWVAPLAAIKRPETAFVISIAGPATPPWEEGHWNVLLAMRRAGFGSESIAEAELVMAAWDNGVRRGGDYQAFSDALGAARSAVWFEASGLERYFSANVPQWVTAWYAGVLDFDPVPVLRELEMPFLSLMGDHDEEQPWDRSAEIYMELEAQGHPISVHIYEGVGHSMRYVNPDGTSRRWPSRPADFYTRQVEFIERALD